MRLLLFVMLAGTLCAADRDPYAESAEAKLSIIQDDQTKPGMVIPISSEEWNAWIKAELAEEPEVGLSKPKITLGPGTVTFEALADFGKLTAQSSVGALFGALLAGSRPIKIVARPETAAGKATIRLELLEMSGVPLTGTLLNVAANLVLRVVFDDVAVDEPFEMGHNIDRAVIESSQVRVFIASPPAAQVPAAQLPAR